MGESDIQDAKELGLEMRGYFVYLTLVVPFLIGLLYGLSAFFKWKCCVGFGSLLAWLLLLFVCLSAGIHSMLSLLLADVCYEFDLHLASYHLETSDLYGTHENLAWLPEEAQGFCGEDGSLAFVEQEFELQFDAATQSGLDGLRDVCNDEDMRGFMDCSSVQILEPDPVSGGPPFVSKAVDYTVESCGAGGDEPCSAEYYNGLLAQVPDELLITDVDLAAVQVTSLSDLPAEVLNCLAAPYTSIAKVGGVWPDTGWSDLNVCMGDSGPTNATSADDCDGPDELWIGLGVDPNLQACTENGVTIEGFWEGPTGPTAAAVQADCGVDVGGTWSTTGYAWTPMADQVLAAPYDISTILANAEACAQAATMVHVGRLYGPTFASCSTPGDPSSCSVDTAAVENSYTAPFLVDETDALDSFSISPPDAEAVKDCYIEINLDSPCVTAPCEIRTSSASPFESAQTLIRAVLSLARGTTRKQLLRHWTTRPASLLKFIRSSMRTRAPSCSASLSRRFLPMFSYHFARRRTEASRSSRWRTTWVLLVLSFRCHSGLCQRSASTNDGRMTCRLTTRLELNIACKSIVKCIQQLVFI